MKVITAIPEGLSDASSIVFLVLLVGGSVGAVRRTGVIDLGILSLLNLLGSRVALVIPILMSVFGLIAAFIGTPELCIAYLPIILPLMLRLGYDSITATAVALLSTTLGFAFGISVPATIGIGHTLAGLPMFSGALYRTTFFLIIQAISAYFVMRYAKRVRLHPETGLNAEEDIQLRKEVNIEAHVAPSFTKKQHVAAVVFLLMFIAFVISVLTFRLGFEEISGLFVMMALTTSLLAGQRLNQICQNFNLAFKEILVGALICGVARSVTVIMTAGNITDTLVFYGAAFVAALPDTLTAVGILLTQAVFNFLVPSGSGQSLLTLPILIPLADIVGVTRQVTVLATHWGDGITNIVFPTSGYFIAALAIGRVSLSKWLHFYFPCFCLVLVIAIVGLIIAQSIPLGPF